MLYSLDSFLKHITNLSTYTTYLDLIVFFKSAHEHDAYPPPPQKKKKTVTDPLRKNVHKKL